MMERPFPHTINSDQEALDVKPLRSLTPLFPAPPGLNEYTQLTVPPLVCITPIGHDARNLSNLPSSGGPTANGPINATPISSFRTPPARVVSLDEEEFVEEEFVPGSQTSSGRKIKRPARLGGYGMSSSGAEGTDGAKVKRPKPIRKILSNNFTLPPSNDPRESVEVVLMTFDALQRRLLQLDEAQDANKNAYMKAGNIMISNNLRANMGKRIGPVPGVEIRDIFYFRIELSIVGLHVPIMAGIDYMTAKFDDQDDRIALCIVSAGGYENEDDDADVLIYSGQGGNNKNEEKHDQKLERGNLALERSTYRKNEIRVVRGVKDPNCKTGKIYIYDGIYRIQKSWKEKTKLGYSAFKYKLLREPGQPDGIVVWMMTQKWIQNPSTRGTVILPDLSSGVENLPVCLVNDVDNERGPGHFTYVTQPKYLKPLHLMKPLLGCNCLTVCLPGDKSCSCAQLNGSDLPYSSMGLLVSRKPLIFECSPSCQCSVNCRNKVAQKGVRLHFEVFRTRDRGWGLRSWDPIRAGTFICEYTGEVVDEIKVNLDDEEDDYIFQPSCPGEKTLMWNYATELLGEPSENISAETYEPIPIRISAKNMGNVARFMNHSCFPNVLWQPVQHDHGDEGHPHIMFFAMKHIPPMTELTYDYGVSGTESGKEMKSGIGTRRAKKCLCASPNCRGYFG